MSFTNIERGARVIHRDTFDGRGFTDQNSLVNHIYSKPDQLDPVLTHLMGQESKKFPLSFLSEGYDGSIGLKDIQYEYDVINKIDKPDYVISTTYTALDKPGLGGSVFFVTFSDNWFKIGHMLESKNGVQARVLSRPVKQGQYWKYELELMYDGQFDFCPLSELVPGTVWAMLGGAPVAQSLSMGNESNAVSPGKMKNQLSILRKSWRLGGNISNKTVECQFNIDGKQTNMWIAFEQWQFMLKWKEQIEEHLWYSRYNRDLQGQVQNIDRESGLPITIGAGVLQQIPNNDTYSKLTTAKIKATVRDALFGATDTGQMNIELFTGTGGADEFDTAMKDDLRQFGYTVMSGDKFVTGQGNNLELGGYFTKYTHKDGHVITLRHLPMLDLGAIALKSPKHPVTGLPLSSYDMYFIDMSTYDGKKNVQMYHEEGRSMKTGILQGMSDTPMSFNGAKITQLATEQDASSIHFLCSKGITIRRNTHCFALRCDLAE